MEHIITIFLHLDTQVAFLFDHYQQWAYAILFLIIFCETGILFCAFLPGDSLLFAIGLLSERYIDKLYPLVLLLIVASILGGILNYWTGRWLYRKLSHREQARFIKHESLEKAHLFFNKYGGTAIIIARFIAILRTFVPFIAGVGSMNHLRYQFFNAIGGIVWVAGIIYTSSFFGKIPAIKDHFTEITIAIIVASIIPVVFKWLKERKKSVSH